MHHHREKVNHLVSKALVLLALDLGNLLLWHYIWMGWTHAYWHDRLGLGLRDRFRFLIMVVRLKVAAWISLLTACGLLLRIGVFQLVRSLRLIGLLWVLGLPVLLVAFDDVALSGHWLFSLSHHLLGLLLRLLIDLSLSLPGSTPAILRLDLALENRVVTIGLGLVVVHRSVHSVFVSQVIRQFPALHRFSWL